MLIAAPAQNIRQDPDPMPDKRNIHEMHAAEIRVLIKDAKRRVVLLEEVLQERVRRSCAHTFIARPVSGPRDNGEREHVCTKCGFIYS